MDDTIRTIRLGTRRSALARWQTDHVGSLLSTAWPNLVAQTVVISTRGDQVLDTPLPMLGGKGAFTAELERALRVSDIDFAVHSLKDLPTAAPDGLVVGAVPRRADPRDVLVTRAGHTLATLPEGATIGTSSRRRAAQILHARPDLKIKDIRGNVETRIGKVKDPNGPYDATILARAGVDRLERLDDADEVLPFDVMLPAPGQGALGIQCRDESSSLALLERINDSTTRLAVTAERGFLAALGGGCSLPIGALGTIEGDDLYVQGRVVSLDGVRKIEVEATLALSGDPEADMQRAAAMGAQLAREAAGQGATAILEAIE